MNNNNYAPSNHKKLQLPQVKGQKKSQYMFAPWTVNTPYSSGSPLPTPFSHKGVYN